MYADVTQLVEYLPSKQAVASSSLVVRYFLYKIPVKTLSAGVIQW